MLINVWYNNYGQLTLHAIFGMRSPELASLRSSVILNKLFCIIGDDVIATTLTANGLEATSIGSEAVEYCEAEVG